MDLARKNCRQAGSKQLLLDVHHKQIVDLFAGGGGMSTAFEMAFGRSPDVAVNHDEDALSLHRANHPLTRHFIADVFEVDPHAATQGRPVGWLHLSPDCTDFSQSKGGQPRRKKIRGLAWVGRRWAGQVLPDVISLENVKQLRQWGALVAKRDKSTGRVVTLDIVKDAQTGKKTYRVADPGERVPVERQFLVPDPKREGQTWRRFVRALESLGYEVQWRLICAANMGGHTTRERLYMIARRDGLPISWPDAMFQPKRLAAKAGKRSKLKQWKPAADCIDFSIKSQSIFGRKNPLAEATMRRIARGVRKYVLESGDPFIVPLTHQGSDRVHDVQEPLRTVTGANRGELALAEASLAVPIIVGCGGPVYAGKPAPADSPLGAVLTENHRAVATAHLTTFRSGATGIDLREPIGTITAGGHPQRDSTGNVFGLVTAFLSRQFGASIGHAADDPMGTVMPGGGGKTLLVSAFLSSYYTDDSNRCRDMREPAATVTTENRLGLVECLLSPENEAGARRVAEFIGRYSGDGEKGASPALVTVLIDGITYVLVDIYLRMLQPRELYNAQDFPPDYIIDRGHDGRVFSKSKQVRMCGNSVNPVSAVAFLRANAPHLAVRRVAA